MKKVSAVFDECEAFLANAPLSCFLIDSRGRILFVNRAGGDLLQRQAGGLAGGNFGDIFHPAEALYKRIRSRRADRFEKTIKGKVKTSRGSMVPVILRAQRLKRASERVLFLVWARDDRKLQELRKRLEHSEKLSAMAIVAGKVAHEIRTPLNSIFLNNDLLQERADKLRGVQGQKLRRYIGILQEEVERLNEIVRSYLSLARLAGGDRQSTPIEAFLVEFINEVRQQYTRRRIVIANAFRALHPDLYLNQRQFRRVMFNLFSNSRDAMKNGGVITVSTEDTSDGCRITVSDTGEGIPPDALSKLTTPFTSLKSNGSGLGLYLVREIVERHGGTLDIQSLQGEGTSVIITLPYGQSSPIDPS